MRRPAFFSVSRKRPKRRISRPRGIRAKRLGIGYIVLVLLVALAASNTGNNSLFMVLALMLGLLVVSGVVSRQNVRGLEVDLEAPAEVFAKRPFELRFSVANRGRLSPRWYLVFRVEGGEEPRLIPFLPARGLSRGRLGMRLPRRGRHTVRWATVTSLFPFGFFGKGLAYRTDLELLVYPEIYSAREHRDVRAGRVGEESTRRGGRGHQLHQLRAFRPGDDPRSIHWKQTAKTGQMIFMERESEEGRRVSILFDNGVARLADEASRRRFEQLVSEAATAALDYLGEGFQVELVLRNRRLPFAGGRRQRQAVLHTLALVEPCAPGRRPLEAGDAAVPQLRLSLEGGEAA